MNQKDISSIKDKTSKLLIKNMVCNRCIKVVKEELGKLNLDIRSIVLGEVVVNGDEKTLPVTKIKSVLEVNGFELIEDKRAKLIEQIKLVILELVRNDEDKKPLEENYSEYIVKEIGQDYHYLSTLFSSVENITIEQYIILQKIERAKELLKYGELTLSEIAYKLGYSSVQHLSNQFKKVTGLTASQFKNMAVNGRKPLDKLT
jgi:AraC-like DNA-binding protein/copper chaperone CopZ